METLNVERENRGRKLRNIYDEAKIILRQYLNKDSSIGSFESRFHADLMNRKSSHSQNGQSITPVEGMVEEFIDISYSDLGCILNPKNLKNYRSNTRTSLKIKDIEVQDELDKYHSKSPGSFSLPELSKRTDIGDCDAVSTEISGVKESSLSSIRKSSLEVTKLTSPRKIISAASISRNSNLDDIKVEDFG